MKLRKKLLPLLTSITIGVILFPGISILTPSSPARSIAVPSQSRLQDLALPPIQTTVPSHGIELSQRAEAANRFQLLAEADQLYLAGQREAAANLYRQVKPNFPEPPAQPATELIYETNPDQLSGAMGVFWRNALEGVARQLESQTFISLYSLTQDYPEFIPGHLKLAEACQAAPQACETYAPAGQPTSAAEVLERATALYPDEPDLLRAKVTALANAEEYLQAAIAARQFSQIYIDYPEAPEFAELADDYLKKYERQSRSQLERTGWLNTVVGVIGGIFSGDVSQGLSQGISGLQTVLLLGKGEAKFGAETAHALAEQYREQGQLVEDSEILNYVTGIAKRFTPSMGRDFEYEFYVIDDRALNAFALPGGKVFVNTGAILGTSSEAELAGLLGHEIAHAALSHGFQSIAQSNLISSLQAGLQSSLDQVIPFSDFIFSVAQSQHSQEQERQADRLGTRVIASSGYAADGLRNLMATLSQQEGAAAGSQGNALANWLSTHPASTERVRYIERLIQDNGYSRYAYEGVEKHLEIQNRLQGNIPEPTAAQTTATLPPGPATSALPPNNQSTSQSSSQPTSPPSRSQPIVGPVALATSQNQSNVVIRFDGAEVSRSGSFTVNLIIENGSDRPFGFVPSFAKVVTATGEELRSRLAFQVGGDTVVPPGGQMEGQLSVYGHPWQDAASQGLTLVIREGTSGGRSFRLAF